MLLTACNFSKFRNTATLPAHCCLKLLERQSKTVYFFHLCARSISHSSFLNAQRPKKDVSGKLPRVYESAAVESEWYEWWEREGFFKLQPKSSRKNKDSKPFTMILPPPNVTGTLHLGHALTVTVQDVIARWRRMSGQDVLWIPGTDHAGIATQIVVEKQLWAQQKKTRHELGRENFVKEIQKWQQAKGSNIQSQLRMMGASLDWSREYFTMDENQSYAVIEAFIRLFDENLIYRSNVPVSWSCWLQSTISDIEIESQEIDGPTNLFVPGYEKPVSFGTLTSITYKGCENDTDIVVSTTRPETMLGDVAIAVHPNDPRYTHLHGSFFWHPYRNEKIPIICDDFVDAAFGTGAVKITPAHDKADYDVAKRHNLELISVINEHGAIHDNFEIFKGMKRFVVREMILQDLASRGLLQGQSSHKMIIPKCSRSGDIVELIPKPQWFLSTQFMAHKAIQAVKENKLKLIPEQAQQQWFQWFENHQDWCLSRQLWWGHRIPAYKCSLSDGTSFKWVAAQNEMDAKVKASAHFSCKPDDSKLVIEQDEDVLDTWFSSSILPFSSLGWPNQGTELDMLYPLSLMETGNDILLFWVARMVILGEHLTHQLPFNNVLLHGVIRDAAGRKMSKSIGNVVAPEDIREGRSIEELVRGVVSSHESGVIPQHELKAAIRNQKQMFPNGIPQCGTDALRMSLCSHPIESHFIDFDIKECDMFRRFCNKIWQACRYIEGVMESENLPPVTLDERHLLSVMDRWILSRLSSLISELNKSLNSMQLHQCVHGLQNFVHHEFCDVYLESTKCLWSENNTKAQNTAQRVLAMCIENFLISLSPFMPFLTEELYHRIPYIQKKLKSISLCPYPQPKEWCSWQDKRLEEDIEFVLKTVTTIRKLKNNNGLKAIDKVSVILASNSMDEKSLFSCYESLLNTLSSSHVTCSTTNDICEDFMTEERLSDSCIVKLILDNENQRLLSLKQKNLLIMSALRKQIKLKEQIASTEKILESPKFWKNAPEDVRDTLPKKLNFMKEELQKSEEFLSKDPELCDSLKQQILKENVSKKRKNV
ncbi:valine--tRNA ligase-like [Thrips palmi]|uniref:valine--tRNA ligase n=1 Tax=Thrips palmi TaxID=161013 RepID=A0A6P9AI05_THRPL|nr:valine--tRNA ligase-like [Thrips palmi]